MGLSLVADTPIFIFGGGVTQRTVKMKLNCENCKKEKTCNNVCGCMFGFCHFGEPKTALLNKYKKAVSRLFCKNSELKQFLESSLANGIAFVVFTKAQTTVGIANAINNFLHMQSLRAIDITYRQNETIFFFDGGVIVSEVPFIS